MTPVYISNLLERYTPNRDLRSEDMCLLAVPKSRLSTIGDRAFSVCGPYLWNKLPLDIKNSQTLNIFKSKLKKHLFMEAYNK